MVPFRRLLLEMFPLDHLLLVGEGDAVDALQLIVSLQKKRKTIKLLLCAVLLGVCLCVTCYSVAHGEEG